MANFLSHIYVAGFAKKLDFQSRLKVIAKLPPRRNRNGHGSALLAQIAELSRQEDALKNRRAEKLLPEDMGTAITVEVARGTLDPSTFEWKRSGMKVLRVQSHGGVDQITLFVPVGGLSAFKERVTAYLDNAKDRERDGKPAAPMHANIVNAIQSFGVAAFKDLWNGDRPVPDRDKVEGFQIWLRTNGRNVREVVDAFKVQADACGVRVSPGFTRFHERVVVAVSATRRQLEGALELLDTVAEIRETAVTAEHYLSRLTPPQQQELVEALRGLVVLNDPEYSTYVTLLDSGVNLHPLLNAQLAATDKHAVKADWDTSDHERHGHGTLMAGIASFGDLTTALALQRDTYLPHRLESVKVIAPPGQEEPTLFGWSTEKATNLVETVDRQRRRAFSLTVTAKDCPKGQPSEWSASIDRMAYGFPDSESSAAIADADLVADNPRLIIVSAGNIDWVHWAQYPESNHGSPIQDPAQAWNALSVGACTHLSTLQDRKYSGMVPIGLTGGLAPCSRTSSRWDSAWPLKPDVVSEGGNGCVTPDRNNEITVGPDPLRMLTTSATYATGAFTDTGGTSAATADVARLAAYIAARYPNYWPQTVRALIVHGAQWTENMMSTVQQPMKAADKRNLLRTVGHGCVNWDRSMESSLSRTTLVIQGTTTPYERKPSGNVGLGPMVLHELPWPKDELLRLAMARVQMTVTLSYFINPNASERGWRSRFRYQSHGLRFAVKGSTETDEDFKDRVGALVAAEEAETDQRDAEQPQATDAAAPAGQTQAPGRQDPDARSWTLGPQARSRGSIQSDKWNGSSAQLHDKSHIAVFPVGGWWKNLNQCENVTRYALIVTLEVLGEEAITANLYAPIVTAIAAAQPQPTEVTVTAAV